MSTLFQRFKSFPIWFRITIGIFVLTTLTLYGISLYHLIDYVIARLNYIVDPTGESQLIGLKLIVGILYGILGLLTAGILVGLLKGWSVFRYIAIVGSVIMIFWMFPVSIPFSLIILYALLFDDDTVYYFQNKQAVTI